MKLGRAILFVKDMATMRGFYEAGIGLTPVETTESDGWIELDAGGATLALHAIPASIAATIHIASPPEPRSDNPTKLVFEVDDLGAAREHLARHGAAMMELKPWGTCDGLDPEGNLFQIARPR